MGNNSESRLTKAKKLVAAEIDRITDEIVKRSQSPDYGPQKRRQMIACFGAELHALNLLHEAIIDAQRLGAREPTEPLLKVFTHVLAMKEPTFDIRMDAVYNATQVMDWWHAREEFVKLVS